MLLRVTCNCYRVPMALAFLFIALSLLCAAFPALLVSNLPNANASMASAERILSHHMLSTQSLSVDTTSPYNNDEPSSRRSGRGTRLQRLPPSQQQLFFFSLRLQQHPSTSRQWQKCWNPCHGNLHSPHIHLAE